MEDGKDTKELIQEYFELKEVHAQYKQSAEARIELLEKELSST